ncbi:MAG: hypothetical protein N3D11_12055 [Candidatus Sumerlaeia bacterium]|nr:hypothetical protein [Candidatus Sumerlaeia bacterium]
MADDGTHGFELWKSNGTAAGTVLVKDIATTPGASADLSELRAVNGVLFFAERDDWKRPSLWKSDGTAAGTTRVKQFAPSTRLVNLTLSGSTLFFVADEGVNGEELWKSNGTAAGTILVKGINSGAAGAFPESLTDINDVLFFTADDGTHGSEPWKSDGTIGGTTLIKDIAQVTGDSSPRNFVAWGTTVLFSATDGVAGRELWRTTGTLASTALVKDIWPGFDSGNPDQLAAHPTLGVFFSADDRTYGRELWKTDGTAAQTVFVQDIQPGENGSNPWYFVSMGDAVYFSAYTATPTSMFKLFKSQGTGPSTAYVKLVSPFYLTAFNNRLYFAAVAPSTVWTQIWISDGTSGGTNVLKTINASGNADPAGFTPMGSYLYFSANNGSHGMELWRTDGTEAGTIEVADILAGSGSSHPNGMTVVNGQLVFSAIATAGQRELWKSNGTAAGTVMIKKINPTGSSNVYNIVAVGTQAFFSASDGIHGAELWKSDLTEAGTVLVKDIRLGAESSNLGSAAAINGVLYFTADDGTHGDELWRSDGTEGGTTMVKDIYPGLPSSHPRDLSVFGSALYFSADDDVHGEELWVVAALNAPVLQPEPRFTSGTGNAISWSSVPKNINYTLEWSTNLSFSPLAGSLATAATSAVATGLADNTLYYYRACARTGLYPGPFGNTVWSRQDALPPTAPGTPQDGAAYTSKTAVRFTWTPASDAASGVASYDLQIGTSPGGSNLYNSNVGNAWAWNYTAANGQTLYARVRARDNVGQIGPWSANSDGITVDTAKPKLNSVQALNYLTLRVTFNEAIVRADLPANWTADKGLKILSGKKISDTQWQLSTSAQTAGTTYTLTAGGTIRDRAGNAMDSTANSRQFRGAVRTNARQWRVYP